MSNENKSTVVFLGLFMVLLVFCSLYVVFASQFDSLSLYNYARINNVSTLLNYSESGEIVNNNINITTNVSTNNVRTNGITLKNSNGTGYGCLTLQNGTDLSVVVGEC